MFLETYAMDSTFFFGNEGAVSGVLYKINFVSDLLGKSAFIEILQTSFTFKNSENVVKSGCFQKLLLWRAAIYFRNGGRIYGDLLGGQHLLEILQTSLTFKNSEKSGKK